MAEGGDWTFLVQQGSELQSTQGTKVDSTYSEVQFVVSELGY